jgi:hypothetical protein
MIASVIKGGNTKLPVFVPLTGNTGASTPAGPNFTATLVAPVLIRET